MFQPPSSKYIPQTVENKIQKFWEKHNIFKKSIETKRDAPPFLFLEGPPTANGMPHPGHVLTRVMKDCVLRFQTMQGHYILRKAGWDTHGLPVEIEVEKKLGLHDKQAVEKYGIKKFNEECKKSVFKYEEAWVDITRRIGFWLDMENPYITLKNEYIESVWWSLKQAFEKNLLYKGHKVVPYCPRCGTALSAHEISQGYKTVEDPSIFVKFKLKDEDAYFLAWTTTPWTLISNVALAVHPDETYIRINYQGETLILAEQRAAQLLKGEEYELIDQYKGKELEHTKYDPLFRYAKTEKKAWFIILADFVTMDDGTGIVHIAPAFGEDDYSVGRKYDLPVVQLVKLDGTFPPAVEAWRGQFVKDADPLIIDYLDERGLLSGVHTYTHEYPFCWRCDSPLLYYAMESWFIGMSKVQKNLTKNNNQIRWFPKHLQQGRFGAFIQDVKDWALSRDRYWGTPLPIWKCDNKKCKHTLCVGSVEELKNLSNDFPAEYDLHRPFVDELSVVCPQCHSSMTRENAVIDCWYDSGSAFFAQWHYPFENKEQFTKNFPVDFICEALDQTRGWFYSLLAISTFLFEDISYKTVLTLGLVLDKDNQKMSKSKKNYVDPNQIIDHEGADALRWYLFSANAPWMSTRFYEEAVKECLGKFLLTFWNSYNFFVTYAALDTFTPDDNTLPFNKRMILDQWITSRYQQLIKEVHTDMNTFDIHKATRAIEGFIIEDFSNWYLRRSRKRLWSEEDTEDKKSAYTTMYEIFLGLTKLLAPFIPFITEEIYQNIRSKTHPESVHLCNYPQAEDHQINHELEQGMQQIRDLVEAGRALRSKIQIKGRYPLKQAVIICQKQQEKLIQPLTDLLEEELNVKTIHFERDEQAFMTQTVKPNHASLGPRFKQQAKQILHAIENMNAEKLYQMLQQQKNITISVDNQKITLTRDDFTTVNKVKSEFAKETTDEHTLFIETTLTDELFAEGLSREIIRRIQSMRKDLNLDVEEKIQTAIDIDTSSQKLLKPWIDYIKEETRSHLLSFTSNPKGDLTKQWMIDDQKAIIAIVKKNKNTTK